MLHTELTCTNSSLVKADGLGVPSDENFTPPAWAEESAEPVFCDPVRRDFASYNNQQSAL